MPELRQLFNTKAYAGGKRKGASVFAGGSKRKASQQFKTWTHTFVCLSDPDDAEPPDASERAKLLLAGLGEKKINVVAHGDIRNDLLEEYPKLRAGGGFELLRLRGRDLEVIPIPHEGYTVQYLKTVVQNAKVFIRPIQAPLDATIDSEVQ